MSLRRHCEPDAKQSRATRKDEGLPFAVKAHSVPEGPGLLRSARDDGRGYGWVSIRKFSGGEA
jgi:hypothetical protein